MIEPPPWPIHQRDDMLHGEIGALEIDGEHPVPRRFRALRRRRRVRQCRHCCRARRCGHRPRRRPRPSRRRRRPGSRRHNAPAPRPPSLLIMPTVSAAAALLMSAQKTRAPSRANATAVALPLPQPGPIDPAPTTSAALPLSRSAMSESLCRRGLALRLHFGGIVGHQLLGDAAGGEFPVGDFRDRRDLGRGAGDEAFGEAARAPPA